MFLRHLLCWGVKFRILLPENFLIFKGYFNNFKLSSFFGLLPLEFALVNEFGILISFIFFALRFPDICLELFYCCWFISIYVDS